MRFFISVLFLFNFIVLTAQNCPDGRYRERVFSNIEITQDLVYGQVDPYDGRGRTDLEDIKLDFYAPAGDTLQKRPLVVMCFGGGFILGEKDDSDMVAWCDSLAHRGYACASIDYRKGFNVLSQRSSTRAVYRAVQDLRAAIRYLQEDPDNLGFNIDANNIFIGGESAGAITALQTAFLNEEADRPLETFEKERGGGNEAIDLGCLDCSGNDYEQPVEIKGILSMWGAVNDLQQIEADEQIPTFMVHGTLDQIVPYKKGRPFNLLYYPKVYGSKLIKERMDELGIYNELDAYRGNFSHTVYGVPNLTFPNRRWAGIFDQAQHFLADVMECPAAPLADETNDFKLKIANAPSVEKTAIEKLWVQEKQLHLQLNVDEQQTIQVVVFNVNGQLLYEKQHQVTSGLNQLNIDITNWQSGNYFVKFISGNSVETQQFFTK
ncbi:MAG: alpha/beta hydrolase fold domain-containing protein [Saprospiraceae bacterium]